MYYVLYPLQEADILAYNDINEHVLGNEVDIFAYNDIDEHVLGKEVEFFAYNDMNELVAECKKWIFIDDYVQQSICL